jgi:hypothetical protein
MPHHPIHVELRTRHLFPTDPLLVAARHGARTLRTVEPAPRSVLVSVDPISTGECLARLHLRWEASEICVNQLHEDPVQAIDAAYDVARELLAVAPCRCAYRSEAHDAVRPLLVA